MAFWKTKEGEELTIRQFFSRWKQGMENITPLQQLNVIQMGYFILVIGIVWGIIYSYISNMNWLSLIMVGGLIINIFGMLGNWQKIRQLKKIDEAMKHFQKSDDIKLSYIQ